MDISTKGLIEIMSHEGVCLSPYLDSVGVWTIGVGITAHDGRDPRTMGTITIDEAIAMFKDRIKVYVAPVQAQAQKLTLTQAQFDALVSFCYNVGPGNLALLCHGRSIEQIGEAFSLYHKPVEITARRNKEQALFQHGTYSSNGKVLVFPVNAAHKPVYSKGYNIDVSKYFEHTPVSAPSFNSLAPKQPEVLKPVPAKPTPAPSPSTNWLIVIINLILGLFKKST